MKPLGQKELPEPLSFRALLGPSFILLGLGLGSGELILWPYLVAHWGLGIIWGAILGIIFQFFLNMEIERYALVTGESVFVGLARKLGKIMPLWFLLSTLVPWIWPGIAAVSGKIFANLFNFPDSNVVTIILLFSIGVILTLGPTLYHTVEKLQKGLILIGVPLVFGLAVFLAGPLDWQALFSGIVGIGDGYRFLPNNIAIASFLAAFAYSGAGGNLNLAQAFYVKEKGYGMGKYSGKITSILTGKAETIALEGNTFEINQSNLSFFRQWWKAINLEHLIVFGLTGIFTILMLALLAHTTLYQHRIIPSGVGFLILEKEIIGQMTLPIVGSVFFILVGLMLFATQLTVFDATSRIMAENLAILSNKHFPISNLSRYFYVVLWAQIILGVIVLSLGISEPLKLLTIGAVLNAAAMFVSIGLTCYLNITSLHVVLRPSLWRLAILLTAFLFFGGFTLSNLLTLLVN